MLIAVNNFNLIKKSKPIIKNNETLFYLGKDADNRKYFLEKPGLRCGWYYSLNNISCYPQNMRGITFTTCLGNGENSLDKNKFLSESTCDLKRLLDIMNYTKIFLGQFKTENDPKIIRELIYSIIPNNLIKIEKLICDTSNKTDFEIKQSYVDQALKDIKNEIIREENIIRYMIMNDVKEYNFNTVEQHIEKLNSYRNKFILFHILS